jgi:chorismate synthase
VERADEFDGDDGLEIRKLATPDEYRLAEQVQRAAWGFSTDGPVPSPIERAMNDNGGLVLGAFRGAELVGFTLGFLGREEGRLFHYSHMTGVRPSDQNRRVGRRLKLRQREEVLAQGLDEIRWTFDPLQSKNAFFNVHRLGGRPDRYLPNYYGSMNDALNEGLESDRLRLVWRLGEPRVAERLAGPLPSLAEDERRWRTCEPLIETVVAARAVRTPERLLPPSGPRLHLEIPVDLSAIRAHDPASLARWRQLTRDAFSTALGRGYAIDDLVRLDLQGERRVFYLLERSVGAHGA